MNDWSTGIPPVEPGKYKEYIVTINGCVMLSIYFNDASHPFYTLDKNLLGWFWFDEDCMERERKQVVAWMEKPKPYEKV